MLRNQSNPHDNAPTDCVAKTSKIKTCAVVLLYYNTLKLTQRAIQACIDAKIPESLIVVVDNNSRQQPVDALEDNFPSATFIKNPANIGFSRGINIGMRYALEFFDTPYIAIVNSDLFVSTSAFANAISSLEDLSKLLPVGALTGKILYDKRNKIWMAGGEIDLFKISGVPYGLREDDQGQWDQPRLTGWASGAFSVFTAKALKEVGLFSEDFFFGQEEWDLSLRLLKSRYYIYYNPNVVSWHVAGGSYKASNPVLNTFNGYCNKAIIARKHLALPVYLFWLILFEIRTFLLIIPIALKHSSAVSDFLAQCKAIFLSLLLCPFIKKTDSNLLSVAARFIGTSKSWPTLWRP